MGHSPQVPKLPFKSISDYKQIEFVKLLLMSVLKGLLKFWNSILGMFSEIDTVEYLKNETIVNYFTTG